MRDLADLAAPLKRIQPDVSPRNGAPAGHTKPETHLFWPFFFFFEDRFASGQPSRIPGVTAALKLPHRRLGGRGGYCLLGRCTFFEIAGKHSPAAEKAADVPPSRGCRVTTA